MVDVKKYRKKCILHIGMHKTGSSSIQNSLFKNTKDLGSSILYANLRTSNHSAPILYALREKPESDNELISNCISVERVYEQVKKYKQWFIEELSKDYTTIIFSAESFVKLTQEELLNLRSILYEYVDDIEVIAYVRSPVSYAVSAFQQILKTDFVDIESNNCLPNYRSKFEKFEAVFGKVNYRSFDKHNLLGEDVVLDFLAWQNLPKIPSERVNESINLLGMKILYNFQKIRRKDVSIGELVPFFEKWLTGVGSVKYTPSKNECVAILKKCLNDTLWINERVRLSPENEIKTAEQCLTHFTCDELEELIDLIENDEFNQRLRFFCGLDLNELVKLTNSQDDLSRYHIVVDAIDNDKISGWALDKFSPERKLFLDFFINDAYIGSTFSNRMREDLVEKKVGDGNLAYKIILNEELIRDRKYLLSIYCNAKLIKKEHFTLPKLQGIPNGFDLDYFKSSSSLFVHVPKCAGLAVSSAIYGNLGAGHVSLAEYQRKISSYEYDRKFKFAIVRNPWDRFVSAFYFLKKGGMGNEHDLLWQKELVPFSSPSQFLNSSLMQKAIDSCLHFKPQIDMLLDLRGELGVEYIGCFENLENEFPQIVRLLGKEANIEKTNATAHPDYKIQFNEADKNKLAQLYKQDVEILGYTFDNSNLNQLLANNFHHFLNKMFNKTQGMTDMVRFSYLVEKAKQVPTKELIVEVGAYRGRSAVALSIGAKLGNNNKVFSVEPHAAFTGIYGGQFGPEDRKAYYQAMIDTLAYQNVRLVNLSSEQVAELDEQVGLLWVDGDHSYEGVKRDINIWLPRLSKSAVLMFDDTKVKTDGPYRVIQELIYSGKFKILDEGDNFISLKRIS